MKNNNKPSLIDTYQKAISLLASRRVLMLPFFIFAAIDTLFLTIIFLSPRKPFLAILGPIVRGFWGEKFLHYPLNFLLLPKLESFSRMGLSILFASFLTGTAVAMIQQTRKHHPPRIAAALRLTLKRYVYLFLVVFIFTSIFYFLTRAINAALINYFVFGDRKSFFINQGFTLGQLLLFVNFFTAIFIQAAFIYIIPVLIIDNEKFFRSLHKALLMFERTFIFTLLLVGVPMFLYIPIIIMNYNAAFLIQSAFPEAVLLVSYLSILVSSLIVDPLITTSATLVYLEHKESQ